MFGMRGGAALVFTARPKTPKPGDLVRFTLEFGPPRKGEMTPDPGRRFRLEEGTATLYRLDRSKEPAPEVYRLHDTGESGSYGFSKRIAEDGEYRVIFAGAYEDGRELRAAFDWVTLGAMPDDSHPEEGGGTHDGHAHLAGATTGALPMAVQHQTMREIGKHWVALGRAIDRGMSDEGRREATEHLEAIERWARNLPRFKLHKFPLENEQFLALHRELDGELSDLRRKARTASGPDFRRATRRVDAMSCTKCHLKFRWGIVKDLSRFPDLSGQP